MNAQMMQSGKLPAGMARKLRRRGIDISAMTNGVSSITEDMKLARMSPRSRLRHKLGKLNRNRKGKVTQNTLDRRHQAKEEEAHQLAIEEAAAKRKSAARRRKKWNAKLNHLEREIGMVTIQQYTTSLQKADANSKDRQIVSLYERQQKSNTEIANIEVDDLLL